MVLGFLVLFKQPLAPEFERATTGICKIGSSANKIDKRDPHEKNGSKDEK